VDLTAATVKAVLIDLADYVWASSHEFLSDIPTVAREEISPALGSKTVTDGVFTSASTSWAAASGDPCEALALFIDTGTPSTSRLVARPGFGVRPAGDLNGGQVNLTAPAGGGSRW
jgi:hypothetical protein